MIEIHSCRITYVFLKKLFVACFFGMSFSIPVFAEDYGMHNYESSQQKQAVVQMVSRCCMRICSIRLSSQG